MVIVLLLLGNAIILGALIIVLARSRAPERVFAAVILLWIPAPVISFAGGLALGWM